MENELTVNRHVGRLEGRQSMTERIVAHNRINGFTFSVIEFGLFSLIIMPFSIFYGFTERWLFLAISVGIITNCLTVVIFAVISLRSGDVSVGHWKLFNREDRAAIAKQYPHLFYDTLILTTSSLLPFVLFLAVCLESPWKLNRM